MILNFTDPLFTTRVLGFEPLFDRLQRLSESTDRSSNYPPYNIRKAIHHRSDGFKHPNQPGHL